MPPPEFLKTWIELAPEALREFLQAGGWLLGPVLLALVFALVLMGLWRRRRRQPLAVPDLTEDLSAYPPPPALWGNRRLTVYELPVRLRLVVVAPLGTESVQVRAEDVGQLLELVVPGLGSLLRADRPVVRVWPMQLSHQGFVAAFRRHVRRPEADKLLSRWILVMGKAWVGRRPVALGFALLADRDNTLSRVVVEHPHQWMEVLRFREV